MLILYNAPVSTCSQKVRMALWEKGLPFEDRTIVFQKNEHLSDWYLTLNPNGVVPTLVHGDEAIVDSSVINEYLEDMFPERPLRPRDPRELARMRAWRQFIDEVPTVAIRYPSFNAAFVQTWSHMDDHELEQYIERRPLRKHFYRRMGRHGFPKEDIDIALDMLRLTLDRLDAALARTAWLSGPAFSLADLSLMPTIVRMEDLGLSHLWADRPRVSDWYARIKARPAFGKTYCDGSREINPTC